MLFCSPWALYVPLFGTLINLGLLYWKRHSHPINFVLLSTFTLMEAFTLGVLDCRLEVRHGRLVLLQPELAPRASAEDFEGGAVEGYRDVCVCKSVFKAFELGRVFL